MFEDFKVNLIYFWEKNKDDILDVLTKLTFPIWLPILLVCLPFMLMQEENYVDDLKWCKEHNVEYPGKFVDMWPDGHSIVKKWKKEEKNRIKAAKKEEIRQRIELKKKAKASA